MIGMLEHLDFACSEQLRGLFTAAIWWELRKQNSKMPLNREWSRPKNHQIIYSRAFLIVNDRNSLCIPEDSTITTTGIHKWVTQIMIPEQLTAGQQNKKPHKLFSLVTKHFKLSLWRIKPFPRTLKDKSWVLWPWPKYTKVKLSQHLKMSFLKSSQIMFSHRWRKSGIISKSISLFIFQMDDVWSVFKSQNADKA